ncbi:MAG: AraC family transcriptional regulator [Leeuwenhoekiella sp.]|nr:MAG: AraC family transcriptional regulator [Leeuwenhoekiella sp.]
MIESKRQKIREGFMGQRMITIPPNIKLEIDKNDLINDFTCTAIGYYPQAIYHDRRRKFGSSEYILLYCTEGRGVVEIKNSRYEISPNTYIILPPNISHHYSSSIEEPWTIYWVHFLGKKADILYKKFLTSNKPEIKSIPRSENRLQNFFKIMHFLEIGFESQNVEIAFINLYHLVASLIYQENANPSQFKDDTVSKSIEFLNQNLQKNLKVESLAAQQNLSVSRYSELFKKKTGYSPIQYFNKLKIQKSCQFLYFTDMTMKEICSKIGYDDPYYYSRAFKKLMGMPPSKYRSDFKQKKLDN